MNAEPLRIGLLGCGPIAQFAHLPALVKARGVRVVSVCDVAADLLEAVGNRYAISRRFTQVGEFLADPELEAVLIAVSDPFHVPLAKQTLLAGKHVLVEKPLGVAAAECRELAALVEQTGLKLQVGSMKRHDPGLEFAQAFVRERLGDLVSVSGFYWDSFFRPAMQETLLPPLLESSQAKRPDNDPKNDPRGYSLVTHGAHLFDTLRFLGGPVTSVQAAYVFKNNQHCWQGLLAYHSGALGHFDLTVKIHADWAEGYVVQGQGGSVEVRVFLPFYYRTSEVRAFDRESGRYSTPLGEHSNPYKRQLEAFARSIREGTPTHPDVHEGLAAVQLLEAVERSVKSGRREIVE